MKKLGVIFLAYILLLAGCKNNVEQTPLEIATPSEIAIPIIDEELIDGSIDNNASIANDINTNDEGNNVSPSLYGNEENKDSDKGIMGNTYGNITNGGRAALQDDYVYYSANYDLAYCIVKEKLDGTEKIIIAKTTGIAGSINVVNDWLYYVDSSKLYKMKTNGTENTLLGEHSCSLLIVNEDYIYYMDHSNESIYRLNLDGTDRIKIVENSYYYFNVVDDVIYFMNANDEGSLYKCDVEGNDKTKINKDIAIQLQVINDWIYYFKDRETIYKMRIDGSDNIKIINGTFITWMNVSDGWLYYYDAKEGFLSKIRIDGTDYQIIDYGVFDYINIISDWLYFGRRNDGKERLYRIKTDGTGLISLNAK